MTAEPLDVAIPLFQASLVALTIWLGASQWLLERDQDTNIPELSLFIAGTTLLWWAVLNFSAVIIQNTNSPEIERGVTGASALILLITGVVMAMLREEAEVNGWREAVKEVGIAVGSLILILVFDAIVRVFATP